MRIFLFGFDIAEASQIKRVKSLLSAGFEVRSAMLKRGNMIPEDAPSWHNIDLGLTQNANLRRRAFDILRSCRIMLSHLHELRACDVIVARNLDMLIIACVAQFLAGRTARQKPVFYECLDVHGVMTRTDVLGRMMRALERFFLRRTAVVIVSSPGFEREYFRAMQRHDGPYRLLENKLWFDGPVPERPDADDSVTQPHTRKIVVGWVGTLRCQPSLDLLLDLAAHDPQRIEVRMHGVVHSHALPDFHDQISGHENVTYHGAYAYPNGLSDIYSKCDVVWSQDMWNDGANSAWLLPNRIYEASWWGCPSIAMSSTETGRSVKARQLGFTIDRATVRELHSLLIRVWPSAIREVSNVLLRRDSAEFALSHSDIQTAYSPRFGGS